MPPLARVCAFALAWLLAAPVSAELYRWRDAAGREHYASQLHQVPAEHRARARAEAGQGDASEGTSKLSFHATQPRRATDAAREEARAAQAAPPAALAPGGERCRAIQKEIERQEKVIRTHEGSVEANQRWADDIDRTAFSRRKYEVRAQEEARWMARAEQKLERYIDAQRRKGVEPGCLR